MERSAVWREAAGIPEAPNVRLSPGRPPTSPFGEAPWGKGRRFSFACHLRHWVASLGITSDSDLLSQFPVFQVFTGVALGGRIKGGQAHMALSG